MTEQRPRIWQLPLDVRSTLRSGIAIQTATQCVEELVQNAIDADATTILVGFDPRNFKIRVEDNGTGIRKEDLALVGSRHSTSKCESIADLANIRFYGYRGEALASIIDMSGTVEILTKPRQVNNCFVKLFTNGKQNGEILKYSESKRPNPGLTVTLTNFMGKMPVRQKRLNRDLELEEMRSALQRILVMNPQVALTLRDDSTAKRQLSVSSTTSIPEAFQEIFVGKKRGLLSHRRLEEVFFTFNVFLLHGFISRVGHNSKNLQLVYVNKRFTCRGRIHRALNQLLAIALGFGGGQKKPGKGRNVTEIEDKTNTQSELQVSDKYPVFVLNVQCPLTEYDITFDPKKTTIEFRNWDSVLRGVEGLRDRLLIVLRSESNIVVPKKTKTKESGSKVVPKNSDVDDLKDVVGKGITTYTLQRAVHSRVALRGGGAEKLVSIEEDESDDGEEDSKVKWTPTPVSQSTQSSSGHSDIKEEPKKKLEDSRLRLSTVSSKPTKPFSMKDLKRKGTSRDQGVYAGYRKPSFMKHSKVVATATATRASDPDPPNDSLQSRIQNKFSIFRPGVKPRYPSPTKKRIGTLSKEDERSVAVPRKRRRTDEILSDRLSSLSVSEIGDRPRLDSALSLDVQEDEETQTDESLADNEQEDNRMITNENSQERKRRRSKSRESELNPGGRLGENPLFDLVNQELSEISKRNGMAKLEMKQRDDLRTKVSKQMSQSDVGRIHLVEAQKPPPRPPLVPSPAPMKLSDFVLNTLKPTQRPSFYDTHPRPIPNPPNMFSGGPPIRLDSSRSSGPGLNSSALQLSLQRAPQWGHQAITYDKMTKLQRLNTLGHIEEVARLREERDRQIRQYDQGRLELESRIHGDGRLPRPLRSVVENDSQSQVSNFYTSFSAPEENDNLSKWLTCTMEHPLTAFSPITLPTTIKFDGDKIIEPPKVFTHISTDPAFGRESQNLDSQSQSQGQGQSHGNSQPMRDSSGFVGQPYSIDYGVSSDFNQMVQDFPPDLPQCSGLEMDQIYQERNQPMDEITNFTNKSLSFAGTFPPAPIAEHFSSSVSRPQYYFSKNVQEEMRRDSTETNQNSSNEIQFIDKNDEAKIPQSPDSHLLVPPGTPTGEKSNYFSPVKEVMEIDEGESHQLSEYFTSDNDNDKGKCSLSPGEVRDDCQNMFQIEEWTNWNIETAVDAMGQEWLKSKTEDGSDLFINLTTGLSCAKIFQVGETQKLSTAQVAMLNSNFHRNTWLHKYFPKNSNNFWKQNEISEIRTRITKDGNMNLAKEGHTIFGTGIQDCLKGEMNIDDIMGSKWRDGLLEQTDLNRVNGVAMDGVHVSEYWERPMGPPELPIPNLTAPELNFWNRKFGQSTCRFSKDDLNRVDVIGHIDRKFIATKVRVDSNANVENERRTYLVLFDQHAVHERIRLEQLLAENFVEVESEDGNGMKQVVAAGVSPPISLNFAEAEITIMQNFQNELISLGIRLEFVNATTVHVLTVPKCFVEKISKETFVTRNAIMNGLVSRLLQEQVNHIILTKGSFQNNVPKVVYEILCSQACHGAIKFGDALELDACKELISNLKNCKMPFQCAHGRPVLVPLMELKQGSIESSN